MLNAAFLDFTTAQETNTALFKAIEHGQDAVIRMLLNRNADMEHTNRVCLHRVRSLLATSHGLVEKCSVADPAEQNDALKHVTTQTGATALLFATECNQINPLNILLENGADLEAKDAVGRGELESLGPSCWPT